MKTKKDDILTSWQADEAYGAGMYAFIAEMPEDCLFDQNDRLIECRPVPLHQIAK
ncbi:MAG: hypothetical protein ACO1OC_07960 [Tuberibacillus sp.]